MNLQELNYYYNKFKFGEDNFHNLMKNRVQEILLVSTFYDAFIFEKDGRLSEQVFGEYRQLNLSTAPRITNVPTGEDAITTLNKRKFDLVIIMMRIGKIGPLELGKFVKEKFPDIPVLLLLNTENDQLLMEKNPQLTNYIDDAFIWKGDSKLFLAMVKYVEDKRNVEYDTKNGLVRVILLVEDSVHYYSILLPLLYSEIVRQTQRLISEELNDINKRLRMRARPKVLLVHSFEDAMEIYRKYREYLIVLISDIRFSKQGIEDQHAGIELIQQLIDDNFDIPILLQSSEIENKNEVNKLGAHFLYKNSSTLQYDLKQFILKNLGFGDFVFRDDRGKEIVRVRYINEFEKIIRKIPDESLLYHSARNHFSCWLVAHGEFQVAKKIRPLKIKDFSTVEELRNYLIKIFEEVRIQKDRGKIIHYAPDSLIEENQIVLLRNGSLGGKGRGLAFLNALLVTMEFNKKFPEIAVTLPRTAIIGTDEFDEFLDRNNIREQIIGKSDSEIDKLFVNGKLSDELKKKLHSFIQQITTPIAVRSSGLLEDSQSQPFAGVYKTFMLPNSDSDLKKRFKQLTAAIKLVFASTFMKNALQYKSNIQLDVEEEKMAVILQMVVGQHYDDNLFAPFFSGVGQSYNFYPIKPMKHSDGLVSMAVGLGKLVVDGEATYRFSPKFPKIDYFSPKKIVENEQQYFYALDLANNEFNLLNGEDATLIKKQISDKEKEGILKPLTSIWDYNNLRFVDDYYSKGPRVITYRNIVRYNGMRLSEILNKILEIGEISMGIPVEIEFAVKIAPNERQKTKATFYILQIRPVSIDKEYIDLNLNNIKKENLIVLSTHGIGNGIISDVYDIIYIKPEQYTNLKTQMMRIELGNLNQKLIDENKKFILIGPGRWGSRDPFLGIPVHWNEINQAKVIIEYGLKNQPIESSQGSHFFHNLVSSRIGYLTIEYNLGQNFIDWNWLQSQEIVEETKFFTHIRTHKSLTVKIDGKKGCGLILKPED